MVEYEQRYIVRNDQRLGYHRYANDGEQAVLVLPAMGTPAGYYKRFAKQLVECGADVTVADLRGIGSSSPKASRRNNFGYSQLLSDVDMLIERLGRELADRKVLLVGHSLGGQLATLHIARQRHLNCHDTLNVRAIALIASGIPYRRLYGLRSLAVGGMARGMQLTTAMLGYWPGYGFAGRQPHGVINDWANTVHNGRFVDIDGQDLHPLLADVKLPVHAVTVDNDQFTPPVTTQYLTDQLSGTTVTTQHYTQDEAGGHIDHLKWAKHAAPLANQLISFAKAN